MRSLSIDTLSHGGDISVLYEWALQLNKQSKNTTQENTPDLSKTASRFPLS